MMLYSAFIMGILGSFHCLGMCGPIAIAIPHKSQNGFLKVIDNILYNSGRIITYMIMGGLLGLIGSSIRFVGYQNYLTIIVGSLILVSLLIPRKYLSNISHSRLIGKFVNKFKKLFSTFFNSKSKLSLFILGLLNGLLPCGLVYVALAASFSTATIMDGVYYMGLFGLGTFPMMALVFSLKDFIKPVWRIKINKFVPYGIAVLAILMILRGLSLGIPYVSPILPENVITGVPQGCH